MPDYSVEWRIEITAADQETAAREALRIMRARDSTANHFHVYDEIGDCVEVDLMAIDEARASA